MLIAVAAMFLQQTCGSIARALPAVLAPVAARRGPFPTPASA